MEQSLIDLIREEVRKEFEKKSNPFLINVHKEDRSANLPSLIPVAISARHVHLDKETLEKLFGKDYQLTKRNALSMKNEFAAKETVTIVGRSLKAIENVRILGPLRSKTQVEISRTDAYFLNLNPPVRESGKIENSEQITLVGPKGAVTLKEGCIIANRHIHFGLEDAKRFKVNNNDRVDLLVETPGKTTILKNVQVRVKETYTLELHLDTDDGNALGLVTGDKVRLIRYK